MFDVDEPLIQIDEIQDFEHCLLCIDEVPDDEELPDRLDEADDDEVLIVVIDIVDELVVFEVEVSLGIIELSDDIEWIFDIIWIWLDDDEVELDEVEYLYEIIHMIEVVNVIVRCDENE